MLRPLRSPSRRPVQANLLLAPLGLVTNPFVLVAWAGGAYKFYSGFEKTNFNADQATKARLVALWPVLYATNADFRKNFQKAIQS
ncbi:hypothetical protein WJX84_002568 [Apatococcus fuscideae]|uniref:Uncharacterized protein n=1 Tax=Apatococcus fuscideae TaxID=2026836 RepID=A0AAW1SYN3_9CHLO